MTQKRLRAVFMRGGTSKGLLFRAEDLPAERNAWDPILMAAMGSPDPNGRQLDGMGGGVSSVSKACVVGPPTRADADVDFTFAQVLISEPGVDYGANCGNMSSAIGPFAVEEGLFKAPANGEVTIRIHNTNSGKIVTSRFQMVDGEAATDGDLQLDGVAGSGASIRLDFADPGGSKTGRILPTGNVVDELDVGEFGKIAASMIDVALPVVFVRASDLGLTGTEMPSETEANAELKRKLEAIRRAASVRMGISADLEGAGRIGTVPKIAFVSPPTASGTLSGRTLAPSDMDLMVRFISMGQAHRATPLTGALCTGAACSIPGAIPQMLASRPAEEGVMRVGHPSGVIHVGAKVEGGDGQINVPHATVYRTARKLFEGTVFYRG
jgi:2-methylaconitate cis-trans-isomerase PrpF